MNKERETVRCVQCELVQWADHANCRRCGQVLPTPIVNFVERVVERVVFQQDSQCLLNLQEASKLISATAARLEESTAQQRLPAHLNSLSAVEKFRRLAAQVYRSKGERRQLADYYAAEFHVDRGPIPAAA